MLRLPLRRQSALFHVLRRQTRPHNLRRNASTTNTRSTIVDRSRSWFWTYATYATYATSTFVFFHIFWTYFYTLSSTYGVSMMPTIQSYDWVLISKYYRRGRDLGIGDIVSFKNPVDGSTAVKRIVGMPGDFVLRDSPGKNDLMIQVSPDIGATLRSGVILAWDQN